MVFSNSVSPPALSERSIAPTPCDGCERPLGPVEALHWSVCLDCTKARHRAVLAGRCVCGPQRRPGSPVSSGARSWMPCRRCLAVIRSRTNAGRPSRSPRRPPAP